MVKRTNEDIRKAHKPKIEEKQPKWAGHVFRMEEDRQVKKGESRKLAK